ncbi:MAG TPA: hypothetical protein VHD88_09265 [Pyrinomonadaceae bacterium]|nr:hypothetical protein [Pyrinomonadaceae bacterium]
MNPTRSLIFVLVIVAVSFGSAVAQVRGRRIPPPREFQVFEPRNQLEDFESRLETVLIKGHTSVGIFNGRAGGAVRVEALEMREAGDGTRALGAVITINSGDATPTEARSLIDYDEIDRLIKGLDTVAKADDTITKLAQYEAHYRTKVDFEITVFKQTTGGVAAAIEAGFPDRTRLLLTLDDLARLRWMILQAKARLDEIK